MSHDQCESSSLKARAKTYPSTAAASSSATLTCPTVMLAARSARTTLIATALGGKLPFATLAIPG